ncbi:LysR family transcriptional regulator [Paenibacillus glycanilyticus]|uniref:LysR family transcriptional regulator n=1 Tax=Paenibacillus glycanilyticus TaxID=126569 RepID=A0ABQ6GEM8_9BACL|nr:LysR family transcriptional regulator [Paenibacillus glycanilyticus]GLX69424.1 LysR family transcriptional regulator [Paenibacillus glycanilyticus]
MNLQQLRVFAHAARLSTLTEVAAELSLKQPTVSFHLKKLEEALGVELFYKHPRQLRLTDAGQTLLPYAKRICALLDESSQLMMEIRDQGRGQLKIGASYIPATYFLPPYLAAFQADHDKVIPQLTVKQAGTVIKLLREFEIDVAVVSLIVRPQEDLEIIPLADDDLKLVLPFNHHLAHQETITVDDLRTESFLLHEHGSTSRELSELWARDNGLEWKIGMELGAIETIKESVKYGIGIGILPWRSVKREVEGKELVLRELPGKVQQRHICLAFRKADILAYHVRSFIQFMKHSCQKE